MMTVTSAKSKGKTIPPNTYPQTPPADEDMIIPRLSPSMLLTNFLTPNLPLSSISSPPTLPSTTVKFGIDRHRQQQQQHQLLITMSKNGGSNNGGGMVFKEKIVRAPMNREPLWSNKYIKHYDVNTTTTIITTSTTTTFITTTPTTSTTTVTNPSLCLEQTERKLKIHHDMISHAQSIIKCHCGPSNTSAMDFMKGNFSRKFQVKKTKQKNNMGREKGNNYPLPPSPWSLTCHVMCGGTV